MSTLPFVRSEEERRDPVKAWARDDPAFFASGACHILAFLFVQLHRHEGFRAILLKPEEGGRGTHVFASDGRWAFDFNGWVLERDLLDATEVSYSTAYPGWSYDLVPLGSDLDSFCAEHAHRPPECFAHLPWQRAYDFINRFPARPPALADCRAV